jgi:hypothetical protein
MPTDFSLSQTADELEAQIRANRLVDFPVAWADELVFPTYAGLSLWNITHSLAALLGVEWPNAVPLDNRVWGDQPPTDINRVVLYLMDGLGYRYLQHLLTEDADSRSAVTELTGGKGPLPLTSILPSTTATALPTLWTGYSPVAHGMLGTIMYLREFSMLGNMLKFSPATGQHPAGSFEQWGSNPESFIPLPGLSETLAAADVATHLVVNHHLNGTGLSRILHRGVQHRHLHLGTSDKWLRMHDVLRATVGQRCLVSIYDPAVDSLSHRYGATSRYVETEIKHQLYKLRDLLTDSAVHDGHTLVLIVADHGHEDADKLAKVVEAPPIREALRSGMGCEMRFAYAYLRDGQRQAVIDTLEGEFSDCVTWIDGQTAIEAGFFGPETPHPEMAHRLGDLILIPRPTWRVVEPTLYFEAPSLHGGMSANEMLIPLLWNQI